MKFRLYDKQLKEFITSDSNITISLSGRIVESMIDNDAHNGSYMPHYALGQEDVSGQYIMQVATGYIFKGEEVWEGGLFECEGAILKVSYSIENATYMLLAQQEHVWFLTALKAYENIVSCIGNVLTHPELWEVAE